MVPALRVRPHLVRAAFLVGLRRGLVPLHGQHSAHTGSRLEGGEFPLHDGRLVAVVPDGVLAGVGTHAPSARHQHQLGYLDALHHSLPDRLPLGRAGVVLHDGHGGLQSHTVLARLRVRTGIGDLAREQLHDPEVCNGGAAVRPAAGPRAPSHGPVWGHPEHLGPRRRVLPLRTRRRGPPPEQAPRAHAAERRPAALARPHGCEHGLRGRPHSEALRADAVSLDREARPQQLHPAGPRPLHGQGPDRLDRKHVDVLRLSVRVLHPGPSFY
mmetsp:Transcript_24804/g.73996  ORF Transcript_24804/g.73996 Transcript_24804/m.73996 type:complete len:270 (+) Transcript_24804:424-1233(+)